MCATGDSLAASRVNADDSKGFLLLTGNTMVFFFRTDQNTLSFAIVSISMKCLLLVDLYFTRYVMMLRQGCNLKCPMTVCTGLFFAAHYLNYSQVCLRSTSLLCTPTDTRLPQCRLSYQLRLSLVASRWHMIFPGPTSTDSRSPKAVRSGSAVLSMRVTVKEMMVSVHLLLFTRTLHKAKGTDKVNNTNETWEELTGK